MDVAAAALAATARAQLASALSSLPPSPKRLFVDDDLYCRATSSSPLLNMFTSADALRKTHGVSHILPLSGATSALPQAPACAIFLLRPSTRAARHVAAAIEAAGATARSLVLVTPRRSRVVERVLTASIGSGFVRIAVLPLGFLPFDDGLVTLHWPRAFAQVVLEGNNSAILAAAAGLAALAEALNVDFDTVRTAGAAGAATAKELLDVTGRKVHRVVPGHSRTPSAGAMSVADDRSVRSDDDHQDPSPPLGEDLGESPSAVPPIPVSFFGKDVTVARVLAGKHLEKGGGSKRSGSLSSALASRHKRPVTLVIIDRNVDVVTPLLTQWTYEGLLDEAVGLLRGNVMDVGVNEILSEDAAGMLGADAAPRQTPPNRAVSNRRVQKRLRADGDPIFGQLRDLNYWAAARLLGSVASSVQAYYDARPGRDTAEIGQVKDYVRGLREVKSEHRSAAVHTALAAEISARTFEQAAFKRRFELEREMLDGSSPSGRRILLHDAISRSEPLAHVFRLLCLWSLTGGGVDADSFEFLRRELVASYGLSKLSLLGKLERAGLLSRSARIPTAGNMPWSPFVKFGFGGGGNSNEGDGAGADHSDRAGGHDNPKASSSSGSPSASVVGYSWQFVRAAMHLMSEFEPEAASSGGIAGPYSGYIPLTVRLIEAGISPSGWAKLPRIATHTLLLPPGHSVDELSVAKGTMAPAEDAPAYSSPSMPALEDADLGEVDSVVLFIGGVSRAEASAVRAAGAKAGKRILIATTDLCGANQFVTMT